MARPRLFDEDHAIATAMRVFWSKGYAATSTEDLCEAIGLKRSSLYNTFTSKHRLFVLALKRYMDDKTLMLRDILDAETSAREKLRLVLRTTVDDELNGTDGCLVVNSIMELAREDHEVARLLAANAEERIVCLRATIQAGQRDGDIDRERDPRELAEFIVATIGGLRVTARSGAGRRSLESIMDISLAAV
ncbi:MAG: TetR/AcrR family transcriptional regulator [Stackebrandtia sp.]